MESSMKRDKVQGEGNYDAARKYNKATGEFIKSGKVEPAARGAAPKNSKEEAEMKAAERTGKSRAKEVDPALARNYRQGTKR
jgi:hypothetical protein